MTDLAFVFFLGAVLGFLCAFLIAADHVTDVRNRAYNEGRADAMEDLS